MSKEVGKSLSKTTLGGKYNKKQILQSNEIESDFQKW